MKIILAFIVFIFPWIPDSVEKIPNEDCEILSLAVNSVVKGASLLISDKTAAKSWQVGDEKWQNAPEMYGLYWDNSYADWFRRNSEEYELESDCVESLRKVELFSLSDYDQPESESMPGHCMLGYFPDASTLIFTSVPGFNEVGDKAILELSQVCLDADCGCSWIVLLEKKDAWEIVDVTTFEVI